MATHYPWLKLSLILLLALLTRIALAEVSWPEELSGKARRAAAVVSESLADDSGPDYLLSLGTGLAVIDQQMGWVMHWGAMGKVVPDQDWYVGMDVGVHYWRHSPITSGASMTGIQMLASGYYAFDLGKTSFLTPYLGLSAGPFLRYRENANLAASLSVILRPGMRFRFTDVISMSLEPRIGLLEGGLVVQGQGAAVFSL